MRRSFGTCKIILLLILKGNHTVRVQGDFKPGSTHRLTPLYLSAPRNVWAPNPARPLDQYTASIKLMKRGQGQAGWKLMHDLHEFAKQVFKDEHPGLIGVLITMARTPPNEFPRLYERVWEYFARLASIIYQNYHHPIALLCHFLVPQPQTTHQKSYCSGIITTYSDST